MDDSVGNAVRRDKQQIGTKRAQQMASAALARAGHACMPAAG